MVALEHGVTNEPGVSCGDDRSAGDRAFLMLSAIMAREPFDSVEAGSSKSLDRCVMPC
jgi:hypothetical protein